MENNFNDFIQRNSPDGGFLQSFEWRKFQESIGRKTYNITDDDFWANIIEHSLPIVGKYFYVPRGPVMESQKLKVKSLLEELLELAKKNTVGWIRIEPETEEVLSVIRNSANYKTIKAPHDVQPRELFIINIMKSEEELLAEMKPKTRYNIRLAEKKGVSARVILPGSGMAKYVNEFIRLTQVMAERQGITTHPESYYRKMIKTIPENILKLYVAEYQNRIIAANLVVFFGETCTYLHGASDDEYRNVMAPYLLQWQQIKDAKLAGCARYDFGGVKTIDEKNNWAGITKFKLGFSPDTKPTEFPGCYDLIINQKKYWLYRSIQRIKSFIK